MNILFYYFAFFLITAFSCFLHFITKEEHKEIEKTSLKFVNLTQIFFLIVTIIIFPKNMPIILFNTIVIVIYLVIMNSSMYDFKKEHIFIMDYLILSMYFFIYSSIAVEVIFMIIIWIFAMIMKKTFDRFSIKKEIIYFVLYNLMLLINLVMFQGILF